MMTLMTGILGLGHHLGGWRHRDSWPETVMNIDHAIWIAQEAERGKLDLVFIADGNAGDIRDNAKVQEVYFGTGKTFAEQHGVAP